MSASAVLLLGIVRMTKDDLREEIKRRGGNTKNSRWTEEQLEEELASLPDVPREATGRGVRRGSADADKKRKSGDVDPALEAPSTEKKQKLPELRGCDDEVDGNKPSEALVDECEKVLRRNVNERS